MRMGGAGGPAPRNRRGSPRGSRSRCASSGHCTERDSAAPRRRIVTVPPRRRKRYRYRLRRLTPVGVAIVAAGLGGAWVGSHQGSTPLAAAATPPRQPQVVQSAAKPVVAAVPEHLLVGGSLLRHTFAPALLASSAVL